MPRTLAFGQVQIDYPFIEGQGFPAVDLTFDTSAGGSLFLSMAVDRSVDLSYTPEVVNPDLGAYGAASLTIIEVFQYADTGDGWKPVGGIYNFKQCVDDVSLFGFAPGDAPNSKSVSGIHSCDFTLTTPFDGQGLLRFSAGRLAVASERWDMVPEPSTLGLISTGLAALALTRRRRQ